MITWGMVGNSHDASLAVFETKLLGISSLLGTKLLWAGLSKDFSGVPNDPDLNDDIVKHALQYGNPGKVVWYERPLLKTARQLWAGQGWLYKENNIREYLKRWDIRCKIEYTQHHKSHAAYAYYTQPHNDCAVVCLDSIGEFETLTVWHGKDNKLKKIHSQGYPHSLGLFYSAMTQRMGLVPQRDEYLVAQWAKKGNPKRFAPDMRKDLIDVDHTKHHPHHPKLGNAPYLADMHMVLRDHGVAGLLRWWCPTGGLPAGGRHAVTQGTGHHEDEINDGHAHKSLEHTDFGVIRKALHQFSCQR